MKWYTVLFLILPINSVKVSYDQFKVFEVNPITDDHIELLRNYDQDERYDFWSHSHVMVAPEVQEDFENMLTQQELDYKILIHDVQKTIDEENARQSTARTLSQSAGDVTFTHYMEGHEMNNYLRKLVEKYPDTVRLVNFGTSYEGREMLLLEISSDNFATDKPMILVDAGIHAREWIAPATALYLIYQLVENPENHTLLENVNWAVMPLLNPDGYAFTQTGDRLWRKTRTPPLTTQCYGVDGNRNFDYQWLTAGASDNECAETYAGPEPFSEVECQLLANYFEQHKDEIKLYLTLHSYGPLLLFPFGHTTDPADNFEELNSLAAKVAERIRAVNGTEYVYGSSSTTLYAVSGSSRDYAKGAMGIDLSYTIELPPGGRYGFNPTADRIIPIVQETFEGFKVYHQHIEEKHVLNVTVIN